jgi:hypothetical protein
MTSWVVKAIAQRAIGALPSSHYWNELLQQLANSLELTDERFDCSLRNCRYHLDHFRRYQSTTSANFSAFELGTGWFAVVPIGLFLCGARTIWTWDVAPLLKLKRLKLAICRFLELEQAGSLQEHLRPLPERITLLREVMKLGGPTEGPTQLLERLGIHYRIGNARLTGLPPQSVDLIVSDVVLEHLSAVSLSEILQEFRRISAPDAVMSHWIDLSDQYASFDPKITKFNFLRYPNWLWRCLNNPIIPLNRLRISDYRRAFNDNGFQIVDETDFQGDPAELERTPLARRFRGYPVEDLSVIGTQLVAVPR